MNGVESPGASASGSRPSAIPRRRHTAYSTPEKRAIASSGMDGFAAKPLSPEKIKATIQNLSGPLRAGSSIQIRTAEEPPTRALDLSIFRYMADQNPERVRQLAEEFIAALDKDVVRSPRPCAPAASRIRAGRPIAFSPRPRWFRHQGRRRRRHDPGGRRNGDLETPRATLASFEAEVAPSGGFAFRSRNALSLENPC